tara:strand:- start:6068 stop:7222 length:1155 start_codon:yes stop_codon:yes gene_type:complete
MISLMQPYTGIDEKKYVLDVLKSNNYVDGKYQNKTQRILKNILNVDYLALTQSCSSALEAAGILLNLKSGDEVLVPSYTFTSTVNAIVMRGAKPIFVDIDYHNLNLSIDDLKKKITKKTRALFLVHYGGYSCNLDEILILKKKFKFYLVEDVAHGIFGKYKNKFLGTFGDISAFSFHQTKNFSGGGQCGALVVNNKKFINKVDEILDKGTNRKKILHKSQLIKKKNLHYNWRNIGSEYRATEISSAILYAQLKNRKKIQLKRKQIWEFYNRLFISINSDKYNLIINKNFNLHPYHLFTIIFKKSTDAFKFCKFLQKKKISATFHYIPLHSSPFGKKIVGNKKFKLKVTDEIYDKVVRLPLHFSVTKKDLRYIKEAVILFFKKND